MVVAEYATSLPLVGDTLSVFVLIPRVDVFRSRRHEKNIAFQILYR
jgi:hypothetical protein